MTTHFILMAKGGVGKSFIASLLAQYLKAQGKDLYCADTDPTNATFHSIKGLGAQHINISGADMRIDKSKFDVLMERLVEHPGDSVVDTGASSFLPMMEYLSRNKVFPLLAKFGKRAIIHAPLVGGQGMDETIRGLDFLLRFEGVSIVVWENEKEGPVVKNGQRFHETDFFKSAGERVIGIVNIEQMCPDTTLKDVTSMNTKRLTFAEVMDSKDFLMMNRQRLAEVERSINDQLDTLDL